MFAWSHTTYAQLNEIIFNFEDKWDLDYFLAHSDAKRISAKDAWESKKDLIRVYSSRRLGGNTDRMKRIKNWKNEKRNCW